MGLLGDAPGFLNRMIGQAAGVSVTYTRDDTTLTLAEADGQVWVGRQRTTALVEGSARVQWGDRDYLILVSALGDLGEPQEGDVIRETVNGVARKYKVLRPDTGAEAWEWSDPQHTRFRLHVKEWDADT